MSSFEDPARADDRAQRHPSETPQKVVSEAGMASTGKVVEADDNDDEMPPLAEPSTSAPTVGATDALSADHFKPSDLGGDVLLLLDVPEGSTIGIDTKSFTAKEFTGFKGINQGAHLIWWSAPGGVSARSGIWIDTSREGSSHRARVLQWGTFEETFLECSRTETQIQTQGLRARWHELVDYTQVVSTRDEEDMWRRLSGYVDGGLLDRVTGQQGHMWRVGTGDHVQGESQTGAEIELDRHLSYQSRVDRRDLRFSFGQDLKPYSTDLEGRDRTLQATDATPHVVGIVKEGGSGVNAVGEMQFALITGVHLGSEACLQQWWHMVLAIVLRAYLLPSVQPGLAAALLKTLDAQILYDAAWVETSFIAENGARSRDLRLALTIYKRRLGDLLAGQGVGDATPAQQLVGTAFASLEETVTTHLEWDVSGDYLRRGRVVAEDGEELELEVTDLEAEDERGEFAPEVVELDDSGRQKDLLSWND